jgi:hypothetical protein
VAGMLSLAYATVAYDEQVFADTLDADTLGLTARLSRELIEGTTDALLAAGYTDQDYDVADRDSDGYRIGGGLRHAFSPDLEGSLLVGYTERSFRNTAITPTGGTEVRDGDLSTTYFEGTLTVTPSPKTTFALGLRRDLDNTDLTQFVVQEQLSVFANFSHDLTARLELKVDAQYRQRDLEQDYTVAGVPPLAGEEDYTSGRLGFTYALRDDRFLDFSYLHTDLASDLRTDFERSLTRVGFRFKI